MENHQTPDGGVILPEALAPFGAPPHLTAASDEIGR
jgi:hypothetical protein